MNIYFKIKNQQIERLDNNKLVEKSREYVNAFFTFSEDWQDHKKTITFTSKEDGVSYNIELTEDKCLIPWEVITSAGFLISGFGEGKSFITLNEIEVKVEESGLTEDGEIPGTPTPTQWELYKEEVEALISQVPMVENVTSQQSQDGKNTIVSLHTTDKKIYNIDIPNGKEGPEGPQGVPGNPGPKGPKGDIGPQGPKGDTGPTGEKGPRGDVGPQGPIGEIGPIGPQGPRGETGATGPIGPKGDAGLQGEKGPKGDRGETGPVGPKGDTGLQGEKGERGEPGPQGENGVGIKEITTAPSGDGKTTIVIIHTTDNNTYYVEVPNGEPGEKGEDGVGIESIESIPFGDEYSNLRIKLTDGKETEFSVYNGKSAYQIALDNGFEGSEEEWLASLKGEKGDSEDSKALDLLINALPKVIGINEAVPSGSMPSLNNFELKPTTPLCIYDLNDKNFWSTEEAYQRKFIGEEIPLLTTRGNLIITDINGNIKFKKYIDSMINIVNQNYDWNVSDVLTQNGLHKVWSDKLYLTMTDVQAKSRTITGTNITYVFEFDESDFAETGIPAKLPNIPIATPCFYPGTASGTLFGADPFKLKFSYDATTEKYVMEMRIIGKKDVLIDYLQNYSKTYIYYQLETPYNKADFMAISLEEGDKISFENDYSYMQKYLDTNNFLKKGADSGQLFSNPDTTPTVNATVPQNAVDALNGFTNAAKIFNEGQSSDSDIAQDYSWIGDADNDIDYTLIIQNKIKELETVSNGGTIFLGNGVYKVSNFIELTDNIKLIGTGNTIIQQTNKYEHVLVISGSNIVIKDMQLKLYTMSDEEKENPTNYNPNLTACVFINSNNVKGLDDYYEKYLDNIYCKNLTMDNVQLSGSYGFKYVNSYPTISNDYEHYRGCGLIQKKLFFNYATLTNVHITGMYHGIDGLGGSNDITIFCESTKTMVYGCGGYANLNIFGHSYYGTAEDGTTLSMSDEIGYFTEFEQSYVAEYVYDTQWVKHIFVFDGYTMNNRYIVSQIGGASYFRNDESNSNVKLRQFVVDYGRGNRAIENFQNTPYYIGSKYIDKTTLTSFKVNDPITQNVLSGAGIWGNITSNDAFDKGVLSLSEICRYPTDSNVDRTDRGAGLLYALSENTPSKTNPIEIVIDVSQRPICALAGGFIQFDSSYIASDFTISFDVLNTNNFTLDIEVKDNIDSVWYFMPHQGPFRKIYKIKIIITKALYIDNLKYRDSGYNQYERKYNENEKVGICNIGMIDADFAGRAFLGECGGNIYGDLLLNKNSTIKNVPTPTDSGDAVNKDYVDSTIENVVGDIATTLDGIIALQNSLIGGNA